ncbi:MAG TPA: haloacid dehalogenase type II [Solirubrobacterales bacterium]
MDGPFSTPPELVVFDVNGTLSDPAPLGEAFAELGAPPAAADLWLTETLRDGFALTVTGSFVSFSALQEATLRRLLSGVEVLRRPVSEASAEVMRVFATLDVHPDVADGMRRLAEAGVRMATLSNGRSAHAAALLRRAGLEDLVEGNFSVKQVGRWKPAPEPYLYAAASCGVPPWRAVLVAVHPWDVDGAKRAGLLGALLDRGEAPYPDPLLPPDLRASSLPALAERLIEAGAGRTRSLPQRAGSRGQQADIGAGEGFRRSPAG